MTREIQQFITRHAQLFRQGRLDEMLDDCEFPLAIQDTRGMQVVKSRAQYLAWLQKWRERILRRRLSETKLSISAVELPRDRRVRVWVTRTWENAEMTDRIDISVIYYCRCAPRLIIEMIELDGPVPDVVDGADSLTRLPRA